MDTFNVHEAKKHLSQLLDRVSRGEEIILARGGRPIAKLVPIAAETRRPGRLAGRNTVAADFDAPLPEAMLAAFRGERP